MVLCVWYISGRDSYEHVDPEEQPSVAQNSGAHVFEAGDTDGSPTVPSHTHVQSNAKQALSNTPTPTPDASTSTPHISKSQNTSAASSGESQPTTTTDSDRAGAIDQFTNAIPIELAPPVHRFSNARDLLRLCRAFDEPISGLVMENEMQWRPKDLVIEKTLELWSVMDASIERGLKTRGTVCFVCLVILD